MSDRLKSKLSDRLGTQGTYIEDYSNVALLTALPPGIVSIWLDTIRPQLSSSFSTVLINKGFVVVVEAGNDIMYSLAIYNHDGTHYLYKVFD